MNRETTDAEDAASAQRKVYVGFAMFGGSFSLLVVLALLIVTGAALVLASFL